MFFGHPQNQKSKHKSHLLLFPSSSPPFTLPFSSFVLALDFILFYLFGGSLCGFLQTPLYLQNLYIVHVTLTVFKYNQCHWYLVETKVISGPFKTFNKVYHGYLTLMVFTYKYTTNVFGSSWGTISWCQFYFSFLSSFQSFQQIQ